MPNSYRQQLAAANAQRLTEIRLEARKPNSVFSPPAKREIATLVDWVVDNPDFKQSRAYKRLMDSYFEAIQHSV